MASMAFQIISVSIACSALCSGTGQRKHQSSASLAFVRGIHQWPLNSPHKGPVTWKMLPFYDVIVWINLVTIIIFWTHRVLARSRYLNQLSIVPFETNCNEIWINCMNAKYSYQEHVWIGHLWSCHCMNHKAGALRTTTCFNSIQNTGEYTIHKLADYAFLFILIASGILYVIGVSSRSCPWWCLVLAGCWGIASGIWSRTNLDVNGSTLWGSS